MPGKATPRIIPMTYVAGFLYFLLAVSTISLTSNGKDIAAVWPANAVLVALMIQTQRRAWPAILVAGILANVAANMVTRGSASGPFLFGIANMVEVFIAAWGIYGTASDGGIMRRTDSMSRFLLWAGFLAPGCSSVLGAGTAWYAFDQPFRASMETWYFSDALGLVVFTPFFVALFHGDFNRCFRGKSLNGRVEAVLLQGLVLATAIFVFVNSHLPILFLVPLPVMLVTFRLGWLGAKVSVMIVAIVVAVATANGVGPIMLADLDPLQRAFFSQFYLAAMLLMQLPVAAALTSRAELIEELAKSEKSVHLLAERSNIVLLSLDRLGTFVKVAGAAKGLLGKEEQELLGRGFEALSPEIAERLIGAFREVLDFDSFDQAIEFASPDNPHQWLEARFRVLEADQFANFEIILTIQDVTDRRRREKELSIQAHIDSMTGLLNRAGFTDKAHRALAQSTEGAAFLAMIDVDRFKLINDNLGHQAGDIVLTAIAEQMKSHLRSTDVIGRLGGDEFAILLTNVTRGQAHEACERLVSSIGGMTVALPEGKSVTVNISCGMAGWTSGVKLEELKHNADMALYEAKRGGRNRAVAA